MRSLATAVVAGGSILALGGCNLDTGEAEGQIKKEVEKRAKVTGVKVDCPEDVEQKKGEDFECTVSGPVSGKVKVTQKDDDGNVIYDFNSLKAGG